MNSITKPHGCHICDKSFGGSFNLRRHAADIHGDDSDDMMKTQFMMKKKMNQQVKGPK